MNCKLRLFMMILITAFAMSGCGQGGGGGAGLNGGITVVTSVTGSVVTATATYTNPTQTNLIGLPITFKINNVVIGTFNTNNSGSVTVAFTPAPFIGTQTITVTASTGNLANFSTINMNGITMTMSSPPAQAVTVTGATPGTTNTFVFSSPTFVTVSDPFNNAISGHQVSITANFTAAPAAAGDLLTFIGGAPASVAAGTTTTATATTGPAGTVPLPGTTLGLIVPAAGGTRTATISWTATIVNEPALSVFQGLAASGVTTVTITN